MYFIKKKKKDCKEEIQLSLYLLFSSIDTKQASKRNFIEMYYYFWFIYICFARFVKDGKGDVSVQINL